MDLSRVVIEERECAAAILRMGKGMICHTLNEPRERYDAKSLFDTLPAKASDAEMVRLTGQLIKQQIAPFAPKDAEDLYKTRLQHTNDRRG